MSITISDYPTPEPKEYQNVEGLVSKSKRLSKALGITGTAKVIKSVEVVKVHPILGDKADVFVYYVDESVGVVRCVDRKEAQEWAKGYAERRGVKLSLLSYGGSKALSPKPPKRK